MCHTFYGFAPGDFTEIENIFDVGVHEYGSKVCQEKWLETKVCNWAINWKSITKKFTHFAVWVDNTEQASWQGKNDAFFTDTNF